MSKRIFVERVAKQTGCSQKVTRKVFYAFISETIALLKKGNSVQWGGFGTFYWMRTKTGPTLVFRSGKAFRSLITR